MKSSGLVFCLSVFLWQGWALANPHGNTSTPETTVQAETCVESEPGILFKFVKAVLDAISGNSSSNPQTCQAVEQIPFAQTQPKSQGWFGKTISGAMGIAQKAMKAAKIAATHVIMEEGKGVVGPRPPETVNRSTDWCYRNTKYILKQMGCAPQDALVKGQAKLAGEELKSIGYREVSLSTPYEANANDVAVYFCGKDGHIEMRLPDGTWASDFISPTPYYSKGCRNFKIYRKNMSECVA